MRSEFICISPRGAISILKNEISVSMEENFFFWCNSSDHGGAVFIKGNGNVSLKRSCASYCWTLVTPDHDFGQFFCAYITEGKVRVENTFSEFCGFGYHNMHGVYWFRDNKDLEVYNVNNTNSIGHRTGGIFLTQCSYASIQDCSMVNITTKSSYGPIGCASSIQCKVNRINYIICINTASGFDPTGGQSTNLFFESVFKECLRIEQKFYSLSSFDSDDSTMIYIGNINQNVCDFKHCSEVCWIALMNIIPELLIFTLKY